MSTGTSYLVWAERFELKELTSAANGTYNKEGRKESKGSKLIVRSWGVDRNINDNNELYVFDEEETDRLDEIRQANKLKQSSIKTETPEDKLAAAMVKAMGGASSNVNEELEELIEEAEDLGIVLKGRKTVKSVQKKIDEFKESEGK